MEKIFSYGTLMLPKIQKDLFDRIIVGKKDILNNYIKKSIIIEKEKYPCIFFQEKSQVEGFIIEVTPEELSVTDKYEGQEYKRIKVLLNSGLESWVYMANI